MHRLELNNVILHLKKKHYENKFPINPLAMNKRSLNHCLKVKHKEQNKHRAANTA